MPKKAQIGLQLNWIFIIIVGGLILIFFFMLTGKQKEVTETKIAQTIRYDLSSIFTSAKITSGSAILINVPNIDITYDCTGYGVGGAASVKPQVAFSPSLLKGFQLMAWTLDWSVPFRAVNVQYITSPNMRYIIVDDDDQDAYSKADKLMEILPEQQITERGEQKVLLNREKKSFSDLNSIRDLNNYKVRIIYFSDPSQKNVPPDLQSMEDDDLTALYVNGGIDGAGKITFYKKKGSQWKADPGSGTNDAKTFYLGTSSLLGAIFTDSIDTYNCNMQNAYHALDTVSAIYKERTAMIKGLLPQGSSCRGMLRTAEESITTIHNANKNLLDAPPSSSANLDAIALQAVSLESQNRNLQRLSCPEVY